MKGLLISKNSILLIILIWILLSSGNIGFAHYTSELIVNQEKIEDNIDEKTYEVDVNYLIERLLRISSLNEGNHGDDISLIVIILVLFIKDKFNSLKSEDIKHLFNHYTLKYKDKLTISIKYKKEKN